MGAGQRQRLNLKPNGHRQNSAPQTKYWRYWKKQAKTLLTMCAPTTEIAADSEFLSAEKQTSFLQACCCVGGLDKSHCREAGELCAAGYHSQQAVR